MWIHGYKIRNSEPIPYYVQDHIKRLVCQTAAKYGLKCKCSVHSEACYLYTQDKIISIRNHAGKNYDIAIYLSEFDTWQECERHFIENYLQQTLDT